MEDRHQEELKHQERGASRDLKSTIGSSPVFGAYAEPITPKWLWSLRVKSLSSTGHLLASPTGHAVYCHWDRELSGAAAKYLASEALPQLDLQKIQGEFCPPVQISARWVLVLLQIHLEAVSWLEHKPPQSVGDLRGVRTYPLCRWQSCLWPLVYKGKLQTGRQLWGHLALGGSGSALVWMMWKTGVSDVTRLQSQTAQKHRTLHFPVAFPFLVSLRTISTISICVHVCYVRVYTHP